jgi:hypothetical protein
MRTKRTFRSAGGEPVSDRLLNHLLVGANPVTDTSLQSSELALALDGIGERILATRRHSSRRPPRRLTVALAFAGAALVLAAVAFGSMLTTHTGIFGAAGMTENDTTEFLRTDAPDFPPLVAKLVADIQFPPGDSATGRVQQYVQEYQPGSDGVPQLVQAVGVKSTVAHWAMCAWRGYWLQEHSSGNVAQQTLAAAALVKVASSDAVKKTDSWWPKYVALAKNEAQGSAAAPTDIPNWYAANCNELPKPWASK